MLLSFWIANNVIFIDYGINSSLRVYGINPSLRVQVVPKNLKM